MNTGDHMILALIHKIKVVGAWFILLLPMMPQFAFGQSFSETLTENLKAITSFEPTRVPNKLENDGFELSTKEMMIARLENDFKSAKSEDERKAIEESQKRVASIEYKKQLKLSEKTEENILTFLTIEKFDEANGGDEVLELQDLRFEDEYRVFTKSDFLQCREGYEILVGDLGEPDSVRDLVSDSTTIPFYYFDTPHLSAQWIKEEKSITFTCDGFINSQYFFDESEYISMNTEDEIRTTQNILNFFGFNPGPVDGNLGEASLTALGRFQECIGARTTRVMDVKQFNFLVDSYRKLALTSSSSSCDQLQEIVPRQLMQMKYTVKVSKVMRTPKVNNITWLLCLRTSHVARYIESGRVNETEPNDMTKYGIDTDAGLLYAGLNKSLISDDLTVTDANFQVRFTTESSEATFDKILTDLSFDRMTGALLLKQEFLNSGKLEAVATNKLQCSKVVRSERKF